MSIKASPAYRSGFAFRLKCSAVDGRDLDRTHTRIHSQPWPQIAVTLFIYVHLHSASLPSCTLNRHIQSLPLMSHLMLSLSLA